ENLSLEKLNEHLHAWLDGEYHRRIHSTTGQTPLQRYLAHLSLLRSAPKDLYDYFREVMRRKVDKDRTVTLNGNLFEAPVGLIGKHVTAAECLRALTFFDDGDKNGDLQASGRTGSQGAV